MTTDPESLFRRALEATLNPDHATVVEVFTEDVVAWSPTLAATSREELEAQFEEHDDALSNIDFSVDALDVVGDKAFAEWRLTADHTGALVIDDDLVFEPTGRRIVLAGATVAEFRGEQVSAIRNYFDDAAIIEQLLLDN